MKNIHQIEENYNAKIISLNTLKQSSSKSLQGELTSDPDKVIEGFGMNEAETRAELIDPTERYRMGSSFR